MFLIYELRLSNTLVTNLFACVNTLIYQFCQNFRLDSITSEIGSKMRMILVIEKVSVGVEVELASIVDGEVV